MPRHKKDSDAAPRTTIGLRLTVEEIARLDAACSRAAYGTARLHITRSEMGRIALAHGLDVLEKEENDKHGVTR